ncbi:WD40-repeat-containing domain protein [Phaeosphaeria sp. MPI-PUGE-AT-0046c]|nr:WD40-repeat-containing domain protein [Phaeosphaeria sp. MPI-PUGE-AT-0046c]
MSTVKCYTREDFLKEYSFPLKPTLDFEREGAPADYASGHPWPEYWQNPSSIIDFAKNFTQDPGAYTSFYTALSCDNKLLAISSTCEQILIYDVFSKELRAILEGTGSVVFRPVFHPHHNGYTLISSLSDHEARAGLSSNRLVLWDLDQHGRLLDEEEEIDAALFASTAFDAILPGLISKHEWTRDFAQASNLHADFEKALKSASADHRRRHHVLLKNARLGSFGTTSFSKDGRLLLYLSENGSTQRSMREANKLPQVVIYDVDAGREVHRLAGHTDAIMWTAFSPDDQHVASVSWDGTMRMYSAETGVLDWSTETSGGQSWAGSFTPDSKRIVWSGKSGMVVQVHDVSNGSKVATFPKAFNNWCRHMEWHPDGQQLALCAGKHAYIWRPFDDSDGAITQHFLLDEDKDWHMQSISSLSWTIDGAALILQFSDGTRLVYSMQTNSKELFRRPKGVQTAWVDRGTYGVLSSPDEPDFYINIDGDGKVRYSRASVPAFPPWWEKEPASQETPAPVKKLYPETGKYVKITKVSSKDVTKGETEQESWVNKGAEFGSAE